MEIESILTKKGVKYYGVFRAYNGAIDFWGMRSHTFAKPEYITKKVGVREAKRIVLKDPNKVVVTYTQGDSDEYELVPSKLTAEQRVFLEEHMQRKVTESRELSESEMVKVLDKIQGFLGQGIVTADIVVREKSRDLEDATNRFYVAGIVVMIAIIIIVFFAAAGVIISRLI
jgi:hypothetical protein